MNKVLEKTSWQQKGILFITVYLVYIFSGKLFVPILREFNLENNIIIVEITKTLLTLVLSLIIYLFLKDTKILKTKIKLNKSATILLLIFFIVLLYSLIFSFELPEQIEAVFHVSFNEMLPSFLSALSAGVWEEMLVRGLAVALFFQLFQKEKNVLFLTGIASSVLFGLIHLSNIFMGQDLDATLQQVFYTIGMGLFLVVLRFLFNNLSMAMIAHFLIDFDLGIEKVDALSSNPWLEVLKIFIPLMIISLICLWSLDRCRAYQINNKSYNVG